ncbi:MAG: 7-carboxy-7-deazaguanine synthase QueE [Alphaproteobacteria bacterium]
MSDNLIPIAEVFGPVIQGEGPQAGLPTIFVRTGGCDYRCSWCDSMFAVDPVNSPTWERLTPEAVVDRVLALAGACRPLVTLSGGNPAMHKPLGDLVRDLHDEGFEVAIETQGTVLPSWAALLDVVVLSPKPPSSGMLFTPTQAGQLKRWLQVAPDAAIKVVIDGSADDFNFLGWLLSEYPDQVFYAQPCNPVPDADLNTETLLSLYRDLVAEIFVRGWLHVRVLPQLHVLAWGGGKGV